MSDFIPGDHYNLLIDLTAILHFLFILFVITGGFFIRRYPFLIWLHVPAFVWGVLIEIMHWDCPLTWLEYYLRRQAGAGVYNEGFIEHYLNMLIYPDFLTPEIQIWFGFGVLLINAIAYFKFYLYLNYKS